MGFHGANLPLMKPEVISIFNKLGFFGINWKSKAGKKQMQDGEKYFFIENYKSLFKIFNYFLKDWWIQRTTNNH